MEYPCRVVCRLNVNTINLLVLAYPKCVLSETLMTNWLRAKSRLLVGSKQSIASYRSFDSTVKSSISVNYIAHKVATSLRGVISESKIVLIEGVERRPLLRHFADI